MISGWAKFEKRDWDWARKREASANLISVKLCSFFEDLLTFGEHRGLARGLVLRVDVYSSGRLIRQSPPTVSVEAKFCIEFQRV